MAIPGKSDDCYYFYYSTCTKGDDCGFRHCEAALGSEVVCQFWRDGNCDRPDQCKFRHMESKVQRSKIACFFERQPGGCKKPHCVFHHRAQTKISPTDATPAEALSAVPVPVGPSSTVDAPNREQPEAANSSTNQPIEAATVESLPNILTINPMASPSKDQLNLSPSIANQPIQPISFNIGGDEESDNDHEGSSSPVRLSKSLSDIQRNKNLGIKTLEQIRMEKIFKQPDNERKEVVQEVVSNQPVAGKDLRGRLKRKSLDETVKQEVASPPLYREFSVNDMNFKFEVKTLNEIKKEKQVIRVRKDGKPGEEVPVKRVKIRRKNPSLERQGDSSSGSDVPSKAVKPLPLAPDNLLVETRHEAKQMKDEEVEPVLPTVASSQLTMDLDLIEELKSVGYSGQTTPENISFASFEENPMMDIIPENRKVVHQVKRRHELPSVVAEKSMPASAAQPPKQESQQSQLAEMPEKDRLASFSDDIELLLDADDSAQSMDNIEDGDDDDEFLKEIDQLARS